MVWGEKKYLGLGTCHMRAISWSFVVKNGSCGGSGFRDLTLGMRLHQRGKHQEIQVGEILPRSLTAKSNI